MKPKKDKYPQVGPRDWMNQHGWYAERGGYKPQQGVLPQIMPGMYPGNVPMVMNQHATEPVYMDVPAYQDGGYMNGMMRGKMAIADAMGNPAAHRMVQSYPQSYTFTGNEGPTSDVPAGATGTHYMSSMGNYAVPMIQQGKTGKMQYNKNAKSTDKEAIRFNNPQEAEYFAEHYKDVAPMMRNAEQYEHGGYHARPGYFYNGEHMVKNKGTGTYANGVYFERGGYPHPLDVPFDTFQNGGMYPHPLDVPFDEFKKGGIHIKPENKGKFNATKKATGKTTEELTHSSNPVTRKRAIFAQNAAKWKHEYGGPVNPFNALRQYATGGPYDEEGGVELPSAGNPWGSSAANTATQMNEAYAPVEQANQAAIQMDPYQNTRPPVSGERANMNETPIDASGFNDPYAQQEQQPRRNGALNWGAAILGAGTGILGAASMMHDQYSNRKVQQQWMRDQNKSANLPTAINPMSRGTYDQFGNMPYNNMSQSPNIRTMKEGGYVKGQEVELSEQEINSLIKKGYTLKRL